MEQNKPGVVGTWNCETHLLVSDTRYLTWSRHILQVLKREIHYHCWINAICPIDQGSTEPTLRDRWSRWNQMASRHSHDQGPQEPNHITWPTGIHQRNHPTFWTRRCPSNLDAHGTQRQPHAWYSTCFTNQIDGPRAVLLSQNDWSITLPLNCHSSWHCLCYLNAILLSCRAIKDSSPCHKLVLGGKDPQLQAYSDADWASQVHHHSISGFAIFYGQGAVSWSSKKQPIVTLSSTEAEYVALSHIVKDLLWHRKLHSELSPFFTDPTTTPILLFCNNQGAIVLSKDSTFHMHMKHINTCFHFVREVINNNILSISYCPTDEMIADIFTKALSCFKFEKFCTLLNIL